MKLHLPLNLLAALMTSFTGVTIGTATFAGVAGIVMTVSQANAADVAFNGTQVDVAANGTVTYDVGTVTASTVLNFGGAGTATITNLNGDASDAVLKVNRIANAGAALSTLNLTGEGDFNGTIYLYSNTVGGSRNNILSLQHANAAKNATIKLGGYSYNLGASVLQVDVNSSIKALAFDSESNDKNAAIIKGTGTTLTVTGDSSTYGGSFQGTVTVDYTGGGTFTLGSGNKGQNLDTHSDATATLKISTGTLSLNSGSATWAQKLVMGDNTTFNIADGPAVTGASSYNANSWNDGGFNFTGTTTLGNGVNFTSTWGKNLKFTGAVTALNGFTINGAAYEYTYINLLNNANTIEGTINLARQFMSLGISSSGSLGNATVVTEAENKSQLITYYGTAGDTADVINNTITGAGHFVAHTGWVHLSENVALTGGYTVNTGAVLSRTGNIQAILGGGRLDAGSGTMEVLSLSGSGMLSASAGTMNFQNETTIGNGIGILVNGTGTITGSVTVDGGCLCYTSMDNVDTVLQHVTLTSGLIDFSGFQEFMDILGTDALIGKEYNLGVNLGDSFTLSGVASDSYTIDNSSGKSIIKFTGSGAVATNWAANWGLSSAPTESAVIVEADSAAFSLYGLRPSSMQEGFGSVNVVSGTGSLTGVILVGGYNAGLTGNHDINTGIWTYITGGDFKNIIGGSNANDWSDATSTRNITGDVHTQMTGGAVDFLYGGIFNDANNPVLTGDVYVAVEGDAVVRGSIIGGSIASHTKKNSIVGNTLVSVTNLQSSTTANSDNSITTGYIIGGSAYRANVASSTSISGNSGVIIDLADDVSGSFVKGIVGGSFINPMASSPITSDSAAITNVIGGNTSVSIKASDDVEFTGAIYGGSYAQTGYSTATAVVEGNSSLTLDGGTYSGALYAGSAGDQGLTKGTAALDVKGSVVFKTGSSLNAGNVTGNATLSLGSDSGTIAFDGTDGTSLSGFDIVKMFQGAVFTGKVNMDGAGALAIAGGAGTALNLGGTFSLAENGILSLDLSEFGHLTDGMTIMTTEGLSNISSIVASFEVGVGGIISISDDGKNLVYTAQDMLLWNGGASGNWSTENIWINRENPATYSAGVAVSFGDLTGVASSKVQLDSEVSPSTVLMNNSSTRYEFTGEGSITNTTITKSGTGTLVLGTSSILGTGTTLTLSEGTLAFGYTTALPTEGIIWGAGTSLGAANGATVSVDLSTVSSPVFSLAPEAESIVNLITPTDITFNRTIGGAGSVTKTGSGTLVLTGANRGHLVVKEGNVQVGNATASIGWGSVGSSVTLENGTSLVISGKGGHHKIGSDLILGQNASDAVSVKWQDAAQANNTDYQHNLAGTITVNGQATLTGATDWSKEMGITGTLTGAGTLTYRRGPGDAQYNSNGKLIIAGDASGFTGQLVLDATNGYSAGLDMLASVANGGVTLTSGADTTGFAFMRVREDVEIQSLDGTANSQVGSTGGAHTLTVGSGTYNGKLTDKGITVAFGSTASAASGITYDDTGVLSLKKVGDGTLTLGGVVDYTGLTNVQGGTLALTGTGATALRNITMGDNSRLTTAGALNVASGSTLSLDVNSLMSVGGAFGSGVFNLTLTGLEGISDEGEFTLITATSGLGTTSSTFNWDGYTGDGTLLYELVRSDTALKLQVTSAGDVWVWQGTDGVNWSDTTTGDQWGIAGSTETAAGKGVIFNSVGLGTSTSETVTISGAVTPESIKVTNAAGTEYIFAAADDSSKITSGTLTKSGDGKLTLNLNNSGWTGAIAVKGGELVGAVAGSLGGGAITVTNGKLTLATADVQTGMGTINLNGGALNLASGAFATEFSASNMAWTDGTLSLGTSTTASIAKALANGKTVELADSSVLTITGSNDGSALNLNATGTGTVSVSLGNTYGVNVLNLSTEFQGTLTVNGGNFQLNKVTMGTDAVLNLAASSVNVEWNGTTGGTFANDIVFNGNQVHATHDVTLSGDLSGTAFTTSREGNLTLTGGVDLDGQLKVHKGTVTINTANVTKLGDSIDLQNNSTLAFARDFSYANVISGTAGSTVAVNSGKLTLTGANTSLATLAIASGATAELGTGSAWAGAISGAGALNLTSSGNITLAAGNTGFTGTTQLSGTGTVTLAGADSLGTSRITINNGVLDLGNNNVANTIQINKGKLANASAKTTGAVTVNATAGTQEALNTIDLGGLSGTMVGSLNLNTYTRLTGITGNLDMTGKTVSLKLDSGNITVNGTTGTGLITAEGLTLSAANTTIDLSNEGVLDILAASKTSVEGVGLVLTTGTLTVDNASGITFSPLLSSLGYAVTGTQGGALQVSGNTNLVYLVDDTLSSSDPNISAYATLDPYKAVGIDNATLSISLPGAPEASRGGAGLKVSNLIGNNASLVVTNTAADAEDNHAVVDLIQNTDAGNNSYGGTISGDHVDFVKKGTETLTVDGNFTGDDSKLSSTEGCIVLKGEDNSISELELAGGDITLGDDSTDATTHTQAETLSSGTGGGTLTIADGSQLTLAGQQADNEVEQVTITGNGSLALGNSGLARVAGSDSALVLGAGSTLDGVDLNINSGSSLKLASGSTNNVSALNGEGALNLNGAELTIQSTAANTFAGTLEGTSGTMNIKSTNGSVQTLAGAGNAGYTLNVSEGGALTLTGTSSGDTTPAQASYKGITVNGGTLNIGSTTDPKTQLTLGTGGLSVTGDSTVTIITSSTTVDGLGAPFVTSEGDITLGDATGEVTLIMSNLDTLVSGSSDILNMELFTTTNGLATLGANVTLQDHILSSMYENLELTVNDTGKSIILTGTALTDNIFGNSSTTANSTTGGDLLWNARYDLAEGSTLREVYTSILNSQIAGDYAGASRHLAAAAGSTVTSLSIAQRDSLRDQMGWIRNRVAQMGVNPAYVHEGMPYFHMWMQGTGSYAKLDSSGDESGYELNTWGGTVGMDMDITSRLTAGVAFTANYGDLTASAADTADGDLDSYYVNLFARYQSRKWSHLLVLTGGWNDASLTRTVNYGSGSYQAEGSTTGFGFGAMYELAYDIAMNEDKSVILQPLFNASIVTTRMDGYSESGTAGNAGLKVEDQELTTAALAVGARLSGLIGSNVFGREALGEVRVNVSQDMGDRRGEANVGFLANPGYTRPVYGAKVGSTAFQVGAGVSVPVGTQGIIFVDGNADIRSGSTSVNGSIGYRYDF